MHPEKVLMIAILALLGLVAGVYHLSKKATDNYGLACKKFCAPKRYIVKGNSHLVCLCKDGNRWYMEQL